MPRIMHLVFALFLITLLCPGTALAAPGGGTTKFMPASGSEEFKAADKALTDLIWKAEQHLIALAGQDVFRNCLGKTSAYNETTTPTLVEYDKLPAYDKALYDELLKVHAADPAFGLIFIGTKDGGFVQAPELDTLFAGFDPRQRAWYMDGMGAVEDINISRTYQSTSGEVVSCMTRRVYDLEGKPIGYLGLDIMLHVITAQFNKLAKGKDDYVIIIDKGGIAADFISIAHNNGRPAMLGQGGAEAILPAYECKSGSCSWMADIDGRTKCLTSYTSDVLGWKIIVVSD